MSRYYVSLDKYFRQTQKYYYFFDALFNKEEETKGKIFKSLGISDSSYRTERLKPNVKNENKNILLDYFKYNKLTSKDKQEEYEICLSKIYYCIYYIQKNELDKLNIQLESMINKHTYLKPLLTLFKVFIAMNYDKPMDIMKANLKEELEYLWLFKNNYFTDEIKLIYKCIMYYYQYDVEINELDNMAMDYPNLLWLYYNVRGSRYYLDKKYTDALVYYQGALDEYTKSFNVERSLRTINNIAYMYNTMGKYLFSLNKSTKAVDYIYSYKNDTWTKYITMHYLYSNYMLKRYEEIISFYQVIVFEPKTLISVSAVICILAAYKENCMDTVNIIKEEFKNDRNVKIILNYIATKNKEILDNLEPTPYLVRIAKQL